MMQLDAPERDLPLDPAVRLLDRPAADRLDRVEIPAR
jgi:hypothetical protein